MAQIILRQDNRDEVIELTKPILSVGRTKDNDIVIRGDAISRRHCEIRQTDDGYNVIDLGSRNGTHVNGARVTEQKLAMGDRITIGDAVIIFEKELPRQDMAVDKQLVKADNFIIPTKASHFFILLSAGIAVLVIIGIFMWRTNRTNEISHETEGNLLKATSSFEGGTLPAAWTMPVQPGSKAMVTSEAKHIGNYSLLLEHGSALAPFINCAYEKIIIPKNAASVTFGGWIKSDPFNKSASGFKMEWFRQNETKSFLESYSDLVIPKDRWQEASVTMPVPPEAALMQLSCLVAGPGGKIYFDDLKLAASELGSDSDVFLFNKSTDELKITGYYNGSWSMVRKNSDLLARDANLFIKSEAGLGQQSFSAQNTPAKKNARKIFFPDTKEWLDYELELGTSLDALSVRYFIPFQALSLKMDEVYLKFYIPTQIINNKIKIRGTDLKEVSYRETINEESVSRIELPTGDNMLVIKYPVALDVSIKLQGDEIEISQGVFGREKVSQYRSAGVTLEVNFEWKPVEQESLLEIQKLLEQAKEIEQKGRQGEAMGIYLDILAQAEKKTPAWNQANLSLKTITDGAEKELQEIKNLVAEAEILPEAELFNKITEKTDKLVSMYKNTTYAEQAELLRDKTRELEETARRVSVQKDIRELFPVAEGYFNEKQWTLAGILLQKIITLDEANVNPETKKAKEMLETIEKEGNTQ
ncbi:MAG: FHA domain-containing protein [Planctomycetes bacterium]|nr:FHA domain-containing protein [Planctomycetota bacterium]